MLLNRWLLGWRLRRRLCGRIRSRCRRGAAEACAAVGRSLTGLTNGRADDAGIAALAGGRLVKPRIIDEGPLVVVVFVVEVADGLFLAGAGHADDGRAADLLPA